MADVAVYATKKSAGVTNFSSGSFTATAPTTTTIHLGFDPRFFRALTPTGVILWEKSAHMPAANCLKTVTAGTMTYDTNSHVLFSGDTVILTATVCVNADVVVWEAWG